MVDAAREKAASRQAVPACEVWEENWQSFLIFQELESQWVIAVGLGGAFHVGIQYTSIPVVIQYSENPVENEKQVYRDIRIMERAAKEVLNKREK